MSHFAVAVIMDGTKNINEMLAPFDENDRRSTVIESMRSIFLHEYRPRYVDDPEVCDMTDEEFIEYMRETEDYDLDNQGNYVYRYNPMAQWDWWTIGGRWSDLLRLTPDATRRSVDDDSIVMHRSDRKSGNVNAAKIANVDFSPDPDAYNNAIRFWEINVEGDTPTTEEKNRGLDWCRYKTEYFTDRFGNKERYAEIQSLFSTWAVITPDGNWHEKGDMGWWGFSGESHDEAVSWDLGYLDRFITPADPEWIIVIVDCHI